MLLLAVFNAQALGLGELHVDSKLGEPLDVRVDLLDLNAADARDLKVKLADFAEYRNQDLEYPDGIHFSFQLVKQRGKQPYLQVSTREYVNDPFLTLLLEVVSSSGKFFKDYTFLIDPPPELFVTVPAPPARPAQKTRHKRAASAAPRVAQRGAGGAASSGQQRRSSAGESSYAESAPEEVARARDPFSTIPGNSLKLMMSTSLSISRGAPGEEGAAAMSADTLQEELIAKEKAVAELKEQISEMQAVIKILQLKLAAQTGSAVPAPGTSAQSTAMPTTPPKKTAPVQAAAPSVWPKVVAFVVLLTLAGGGGYFWYRRRQQAQQPKPGLFDELAVPVESVMHQRVKTGVGEAGGEQPIKMPVNKELKTVPFTAREYDFLEQAEIYLRFGHDKLAEDVLREAIRINPLNPHGYLTLLGIYETRGDKAAFYTLAQQMKAIGDVEEWKKVAVTGRKLDPDNPFYQV